MKNFLVWCLLPSLLAIALMWNIIPMIEGNQLEIFRVVLALSLMNVAGYIEGFYKGHFS